MAITPYTLFQAFWILAGFWVCSKLAWLCIYEFVEKDAGIKYLNGELNREWLRKEIKNKWQDYRLKK
jgi:hypothetical protein